MAPDQKLAAGTPPLVGGKIPPPLGTGMASQAAAALQSQPYRMHVKEAQALGQQPMTPQEFAAMQRGG